MRKLLLLIMIVGIPTLIYSQSNGDSDKSSWTIYNLLTLVAIFGGPIAAVQIQKLLERGRESKERKMAIFRTLWTTRGFPTRVAPSHIEALNLIDLEFPKNDKKYGSVNAAWKEYLDHLSVPILDNNIAFEKRNELIANLLFQMGKSLGFTIDKLVIKRESYTPTAMTDLDNQERDIRNGIIDILNHNIQLPLKVYESNEDIEARLALHNEMLEYYKRRNENDRLPNESK